MLTKTLYYLSYFFGLLGTLFGLLSYDRWQMPYDESGRYLDVTDSIVYHRQELELFVFICVASLLVTLSLLFIAYLRSRSS